jgi:hypothetical protein
MGIGKGWNSMNEESWVVSAAAQGLLDQGVPATAIHVEFLVSPHDRPDLVVVLSDRVSIYEAKPHPPTPADRRQVRRYMDAARVRWPGRSVDGRLIWPARRERALVPDDVLSEQVR